MDLPQEVIARMFVATDEQNWEKVIECFASKVEVDYSSFTQNPVAVLTPEELVGSWKNMLPGFEYTHHQIGNIIFNKDLLVSNVFCYVIALHYLEGDKGNVWTVIGSYDFELIKDLADSWFISKIKFNFKYQDGNTMLPHKATQLVKERAENQ